MPTYEYECNDCGHSFEAFQSIRDEPLKICPQCGKDIRRIITGGSGIIFKGSGFYRTDAQARPAGNAKETAEKAAPPDAGAGEKQKREPAAAPAAKTAAAVKEDVS
ncbi:MAG: zinc ribbon domain-containing protein [Treponema sp.]|jgi:putative FmdB family regulatory protein|nr:zinc ribbon domain-containing protein [Treponema sp.]